MPETKDYDTLSWCHPLRRLAFFRTDEERKPGGDGAFLARMGVSRSHKRDWWENPDAMKASTIIEICRRLGLSDAEIIWVLAAGICKHREQKEPPSVLEYLNELMGTELKRFAAFAAVFPFWISYQ